ncbi:unnamed protein product [Urochloa humidicola]
MQLLLPARLHHPQFQSVDYEYKAVNLLKGEHSDPEFAKLNPMKFVPALVDDDAITGDSCAIALTLRSSIWTDTMDEVMFILLSVAKMYSCLVHGITPYA